MQGKWTLQETMAGTSIVRYAVEVAMRTGPLQSVGLIEPLLERSIVEDVPQALAAVRRVAEGGLPDADNAPAAPRKRSFRLFEELQAELTRLYGSTETMPDRQDLLAANRCVQLARSASTMLHAPLAAMMRWSLCTTSLLFFATLSKRNVVRMPRVGCRPDLVQAVTTHGGFQAVQQRLGWPDVPYKIRRRTATKKKKQSFWTLSAVKHEIELVIAQHDLPKKVLPSKQELRNLGRYDVAKAILNQGGFAEVCSHLSV